MIKCYLINQGKVYVFTRNFMENLNTYKYQYCFFTKLSNLKPLANVTGLMQLAHNIFCDANQDSKIKLFFGLLREV